MTADGAADAPVAGNAGADAADPDDGWTNEFADLALEQLMTITVTSVAGVEDSWLKTPAALTVLTSEEIRRSGFVLLPEVLRMVPGVHVARVNASTWAITSRGFNSQFANKLQVLLDGRVAYNPLFSGVYWDQVDTLLEDVDRIEVVRGPGATLWGANAVNGVINVTTKSAADTQGLYVMGGAGSELQGFGGVRYGGRFEDEEDAYYRVWAKYLNHDSTVDRSGADSVDDWDMFRAGFRIDLLGGDTDAMIAGDLFRQGRRGEAAFFAVPGHLQFDTSVGDGDGYGGHLMARLDHQDADHGWTFQAYYDRFSRDGIEFGPGPDATIHGRVDTFDLDFRQHFDFDRHALVWGAGYRHARIATAGPANLQFNPPTTSLDTFSVFVQDTIALVPDGLHLMLGSKFEHNDFTGFEWQPSARLWWTPDDRQTIWAAVSRPVRTPSYSDVALQLIWTYLDPSLLFGGPPSGISVPLTLTGSEDIEAERLVAYEAGYRVQATDDLTLDLTAFYNDYHDLVTGPATFVGPYTNAGTARAYGAEAAVNWRVADNWRLEFAYTHLRIHAGDGTWAGIEGESAQHQFQARSYLDITDDLEFNALLFFTDGLPQPGLDDYTRLDLGLTWRPKPNVSLSVWGRNLLDPQHPEAPDAFLVERAEIERDAFMQITVEF